MQQAFTLFVGNGKCVHVHAGLERNGYMPDLVLCPRHATVDGFSTPTMCNYVIAGPVTDGAILLRHIRRDDCSVLTYLNTALIEISNTRLLVTNCFSGAVAPPLVFQNHFDIAIDIRERKPVPVCTRNIKLTHVETLPYGQYFVFDA